MGTDEIVRPAREGTVIQLAGRRVSQHTDAARLLHGEPTRRYLQGLAAVVKFPPEIVRRRIGLDPTGDVERFAPRRADHYDPVLLAHRRDCKQNYRFITCRERRTRDDPFPPNVSEPLTALEFIAGFAEFMAINRDFCKIFKEPTSSNFTDQENERSLYI